MFSRSDSFFLGVGKLTAGHGRVSFPYSFLPFVSFLSRLAGQVNLEWLDLSFNMITKIEGLETLTKLTDLSLFKVR